MLILQNGEYVSRVNHHSVKLIYRGNNECDLYIDDRFQGVCPFDYIKRKINKIEQNPMLVYNLKKPDQILLKVLKELGFDKKI